MDYSSPSQTALKKACKYDLYIDLCKRTDLYIIITTDRTIYKYDLILSARTKRVLSFTIIMAQVYLQAGRSGYLSKLGKHRSRSEHYRRPSRIFQDIGKIPVVSAFYAGV